MIPYTLEDIYDDWTITDSDVEARLNTSLNPRSSDMLFDKMAALGVGASHRLLDIGCRNARYSCQLAQRFGCHVLGIDPVKAHIRDAQHVIAETGLTDRVVAVDGVIEAVQSENLHEHYVLGVQWHPERTHERDDFSLRLFQDFVQAVSEHKRESAKSI